MFPQYGRVDGFAGVVGAAYPDVPTDGFFNRRAFFALLNISIGFMGQADWMLLLHTRLWHCVASLWAKTSCTHIGIWPL